MAGREETENLRDEGRARPLRIGITPVENFLNSFIDYNKTIMTAIINKDACTGCETCVSECPAEAITMKNEKAEVITELCVDCGSCVDVCPAEAITME